MANFKIGDKIRVTKSNPDEFDPPLGSVGIIIEDADSHAPGVQFENWTGGWSNDPFGEPNCWYIRREEMAHYFEKPLTPQSQTVLKHLKDVGDISCVEASTLYKIRSLTSRIADLRKRGHVILSLHKKDATGQRYVRYVYDGFKEAAA